MKDNNATSSGNNILDLRLYGVMQDGAMTDGAMLYFSPDNQWGFVVDGFAKYNKNDDPAKYFAPDDGYSVVPGDNGLVTIVYSDWYKLNQQLQAAENGATITLDRDWKGGRGDEQLTILKGQNVTLDLNGHTLDRNKDLGESRGGNGSVIRIEDGATLTIKDSGDTGVITGGVEAGIENFGTLHLEGGTITGNHGTTGAVYNYSGKGGTGTMTMTGGKITGNSCSGICSEGILEISGGEISKNKTETEGGGLLLTEGTTTMKALPVLYFALFFSDDRDTLLAISFAIGLGFAILENMVILVSNIDNVSVIWAFVRGFGAARMHSACTSMVGRGVPGVRSNLYSLFLRFGVIQSSAPGLE